MKKNLIRIVLWVILLVFLDQLAKFMIEQYLVRTTPLINGLLKIEYSQNSGVAFGIKFPYFALLIFNFILIGLVIYVFLKEFNLKEKISNIALVLILSGALGNLIDRLYKGYVVDFISIWRWPNFNLADSYITISILLIMVFYGRIKRNKIHE